MLISNYTKLALASDAQFVGHCPTKERKLVQFLVRAGTWVADPVPGWGCALGNQSMLLLPISISLPLSSSLPFSLN